MLQENSIHILFASRLVLEKWVDILIDSIHNSLKRDTLKWKIIWHICSDWPYEASILDLVDLYPGKVIYHGKVDQWKLASLYRQASILFMPSRFLETFGLTAVESLACGTPVVGFSKWGLELFIPESYSLDPENPVESFLMILENFTWKKEGIFDILPYTQSSWEDQIRKIFPSGSSIAILHDYSQKIWWAEYYISQLRNFFVLSWYQYIWYGYSGTTTVWKRRIMFMFSMFAFWRWFQVKKLLIKSKPEILWMHSILRYVWFWWARAALLYAKKNSIPVYLSHHDIGLMVPFPQKITQESEIPKTSSFRHFLQWLSFPQKIIAFPKWIYIQMICWYFPEKLTHIIFSPFIEKHIRNHFPKENTVILLPHHFHQDTFHE